MRIILFSIMMALGAMPMPPIKTIVRAAPYSLRRRSDMSRLVDLQHRAAVEGEAAVTTMAPGASSSGAPETTTENVFESEGESNDFGSDVVNTLLEVVGALMSFFTDPQGAIQKMVEQAQQLTGGARSLAATVREQRQAGLPVPEVLTGLVEQFKKLVDSAMEVAEMGPEGARQARLMLQEAQRILETARGIVETTGKVTNSARQVAESISRPWRG